MAKRLNVLYIVTDQHRQDMLGAYGDPVVRTPNIDSLAREGVRFTHAFTPTAICGPARASLFTGRFPCAHGIVGNSEHGGELGLSPDIQTMANHLEGYDPLYVGKWHVEDARLPSDYGFRGHDFAGYAFPGSGVYGNFVFDQPPQRGNPYAEWLRDKGFDPPTVSEGFCGNNANMQVQELRARLDGPAEASIPNYLAEEAIRLLDDRDAAKPFFMWMNFWGPHTPCVVPEPYYSMYDPASIPFGPELEDHLAGKPIHQKHISQMWGVWDLDRRGWQEIIARYYGYITMIDDSVGRLLDHLRDTGLYDDTVIVFTADHGDAMGAHRLIEKGEFMYDETYRIPLIARHPQVTRPGTVCDEFVYLHDLMPTLAELATGTSPDMQGHSQSILPLLRGDAATTGRDFAYAEFTRHFATFPQRMIRTRTHKFVFNACSEGELYDLQADPRELINRIDDPACAAAKKDLVAKLDEQMRTFGDPLRGWFSRVKDVY